MDCWYILNYFQKWFSSTVHVQTNIPLNIWIMCWLNCKIFYIIKIDEFYIFRGFIELFHICLSFLIKLYHQQESECNRYTYYDINSPNFNVTLLDLPLIIMFFCLSFKGLLYLSDRYTCVLEVHTLNLQEISSMYYHKTR